MNEPLVVPTYEGDINEHLELPVGFRDRDLTEEPTGDARLVYIAHRDNDGAPLVISFGGSGLDVTDEPQFAYEKFLTRMRVNRLHVRDAFQCWYFNGIRGYSRDIAATADYLRATVSMLKPSRVTCTGTSAGGFAAILFGVLIQADHVVAINPQTLLQRGVECFAHGNLYRLKWTNPADTVHRDLLHLPPSFTKIDIAYGRDEAVDRFHSGRMRIRSDVNLHPFPGGHADAPRKVRDSGDLADLFEGPS